MTPVSAPLTLSPSKGVPVYHEHLRCPACQGTSWWIGRTTAECARCGCPAILSAEAVRDTGRSAI